MVQNSSSSMNNKTHYVPIIRWKRAEQDAIKALSSDIRSYITPLIEIIPQDFQQKKKNPPPNPSEKITIIAKDIAENCAPGVVWIDLHLIDTQLQELFIGKGVHPLEALGRAMREYQTSFFHDSALFVPVTALRPSKKYQSALVSLVNNDNRGVCLRLRRNDIMQPTIYDDISQLLSLLGVEPQNVDLVVDYGFINTEKPSIDRMRMVFSRLPRWRSFTVVTGTFPKDLTKYQRNDIYELDRNDWLFWLNDVRNITEFPTSPNYGDYTIQHAKYYPRLAFFEPSASVRYTSDMKYIIMKGEKPSNEGASSAADQYRAHSQILVERREYKRSKPSYGDDYFYYLSTGAKVGRAETVLRAGINHHITHVVHQIANLSDISAVAEPLHEADQEVQPLQAVRK